MTTEANDTAAETLPMEAILAKLLLLRHNGMLPGILRLTTFASAVHIGFTSIADRDAWRDALGGDARVGTPCTFDGGETRHTLNLGDWHSGWDVSLWADVPPATASPSPLDAETVSLLKQVAPAPELIETDEEAYGDGASDGSDHFETSAGHNTDGTKWFECQCGTMFDGLWPDEVRGIRDQHFGRVTA